MRAETGGAMSRLEQCVQELRLAPEGLHESQRNVLAGLVARADAAAASLEAKIQDAPSRGHQRPLLRGQRQGIRQVRGWMDEAAGFS